MTPIFKKFGEKNSPVLFLPHDGKEYKINAVFSEQYYEVDADGQSLNSRKKSIYTSCSELKRKPVERKDGVIVQGRKYLIETFEPDDSGNAILFLYIPDYKDVGERIEFDTSLKEDLYEWS